VFLPGESQGHYISIFVTPVILINNTHCLQSCFFPSTVYYFMSQTLKGRSGSVSVGYLLPGAHKVLFESSKCLWWMWGLIQNAILPLLPSCWGFSFALGCGFCLFVCFLVGSNILLLMAVQQRVALLESSQEKMSASPSTLPSLYQGRAILNL